MTHQTPTPRALSTLLRSHIAPAPMEAVTAIKQAVSDLTRTHFPNAHHDTAAWIALHVARDLADTTTKTALEILCEADKPRTLCACGDADAASDVIGLADHLHRVATGWEYEAERCIDGNM